MNMNVNTLQNYINTKKGFEIIHQRNNKNYLYIGEKEISLPSGNLNVKNNVLFIENIEFHLEDYI